LYNNGREKRDGAQFAKKQAIMTISTRKIEIEYKQTNTTKKLPHNA